METRDLINALNSGDNIEAGNVFNSLMADKINSAMDDRKVQIAQGMMGGEQEEMDFDPEGEVEEYEDVQPDPESDES